MQRWAGRFGSLSSAAGTFQPWPAPEPAAAPGGHEPAEPSGSFFGNLRPGAALYTGVPSMQSICAHMARQLEESGRGEVLLGHKASRPFFYRPGGGEGVQYTVCMHQAWLSAYPCSTRIALTGLLVEHTAGGGSQLGRGAAGLAAAGQPPRPGGGRSGGAWRPGAAGGSGHLPGAGAGRLTSGHLRRASLPLGAERNVD